MISTVALDGGESLWPIAYISATGDRSGDEPSLIEQEFEQLKEKLADMAVAHIRERAGDDERAHTHDEDQAPGEPCDGCALDDRLQRVRTELTGKLRLVWDDLSVIVAGARDPEDEEPIFGALEEQLELTMGGIEELGWSS